MEKELYSTHYGRSNPIIKQTINVIAALPITKRIL